MDDEKFTKELETYRKLAEADKSVDAATLAIQALQNHEANEIPSRQKRWAYWISLALPPLGLFFAIKFYFSGKDDGRQAAIICAILTSFSCILFWLTSRALFSGTNVDLNQVKEIKPQDIQQLYQ